MAFLLGLEMGCGSVKHPTAEVESEVRGNANANAKAQNVTESESEVESALAVWSEHASIAEVVAAEERILSLTPKLKALSSSIENLQVPDHRSSLVFHEMVEVMDTVDWERQVSVQHLVDHVSLGSRSTDATVQQVERSRLNLLRPLFDKVNSVASVDLKIVSGESVSITHDEFGEDGFKTKVSIEGRSFQDQTQAVGFSGELQLYWRPTSSGNWLIHRWVTQRLNVIESSNPYFHEVLSELVADQDQLLAARTSDHEQRLERLLQTEQLHLPKQKYYRYFTTEATYQHPGAAVVDIDADGDDDLFVTARWGPTQLWVNQGDGTFTEQAREYGLDFSGLCNCAIFADFDNDGDPDVFMGRSLEPSLYLKNEAGHFRPVDNDTNGMELPYLVSTASAADVNGDGLLDLFLGTYGPSISVGEAKAWPEEFLSSNEAAEYRTRSKNGHRYFDFIGPPNVLLVNVGQGRFVRSDQLREYRHTYQGAWSDYDLDGDPDLFVCNDFAPDALYRNDVDSNGKFCFQEVSAALSSDTMRGFGMGASWGDYDNDGDQDLYVSNMFSKAGQRIIRQVGGVDERLAYSAKGNLLFRNAGNSFDQVAGLSSPALPVAKVGWSFGGQFADFDNDGWLDIYVPSGFYSAPPSVSTDVDL